MIDVVDIATLFSSNLVVQSGWSAFESSWHASHVIFSKQSLTIWKIQKQGGCVHVEIILRVRGWFGLAAPQR